jgi:hypothetical protein
VDSVTGALLNRRFRNLNLNRFSGLKHFYQLLQETEHFWRWRQEKVAKIDPYGPPGLFCNLPLVFI